MSYTYTYPRPMVTVDIMILRYQRSQIELLLVQRKKPPFKNRWALPGGFMEKDERLIQAAERELYEETALNDIPLFPLTYADHPDRDPRGRTISMAFAGILSPPFRVPSAGDDAQAIAWFSPERLPDLAFDHLDFIQRCYAHLKKILSANYGILAFLEQRFSRTDLLACAETIYKSRELAKILISNGSKHNILIPESRTHFKRKVSISELFGTDLISRAG